MASKKRIIWNEEDISRAMEKIAGDIVRRHRDMDEVLIVGIRTGGAFLAARLKETLAAFRQPGPPVGILDITLYRDDWTKIGPTPLVRKTELPFSVDDKTVVLVDDVLYTGRTVRAAMDALMDYGRPKRIELAVLVDRGEQTRELPIMANYVGKLWPTSPHETINVYLREGGSPDRVAVEPKKAG
jgi:pyrimidine operon attenuation protein/uracil phosphoribosyltransferase